jgi:oligo-1,6-glucosidase
MTIKSSARKWWKEAIIYQVYPHSFKDSNGDGIGDLEGILSKVDYITSLGIDTVWINPIYASPGTDNGYDISDYTALQPEYGTMADMEGLIKKLHEKKIRVIMDMVINHTSDEHKWFRQARSDRNNSYYTFYHWWPAEKGKPPYRCGFFDPAGEGWTYNAPTDSYYLHYFSARQPDLNWENPMLRRQIHQILKFWLDKGVDGFRMDAITFISKDTNFPVISPAILREKYRDDWGHYYAAGPHLHEYLREMQEVVLEKYGAVTIAEGPGVPPEQAPDFVDEDRKELDMLCHFEGITIGYLPGEFKKMAPSGYKLSEWKKIYTRWEEAFTTKGWGTLYLGNHDQPRMVSHWGDDSDTFRDVSAKMLFTFLLTMRATPFIYNGDEIGMTNIRFEKIEDYKDIETRHVYQKIKDQGGDADTFLKDQQLAGRDNGRTPFQWDVGTNAGFTTGTPWLKINENYQFINAEASEKDPGSILHYVRKLIRLRKEQETLVYGAYSLISPDDPEVYAYTRKMDSEGFFVVLNFSKQERAFAHSFHLLEEKDLVVNNYPAIRSEKGLLRLLPYQAVIYGIRISGV